MYTVTIIGRPNTGKSSLFNRLTGKRQALVHHAYGTTRDYLEKIIPGENIPIRLIDAAGWTGNYSQNNSLEKSIYQQLNRIIAESNLIIFLVDGRQGLHPQDKEIANFLRKLNRPVLVAVNKIDRIEMLSLINDFFSLGNWEYLAVSAETGLNTDILLEKIIQYGQKTYPAPATQNTSDEKITTVAIVGRPNSGKSTLFNTILKKERTIVSEIPGTTRDTIDALIQYQNQKFNFIDTPGIRHKQSNELEYLSTIKARKTIRRADIVILLIDITAGITSLDCQLAQNIATNAKGAIIALNKIDLVNKNKYPPINSGRLLFIPWAAMVKISARTGLGIERLLDTLTKISDYYQQDFPDRAIQKFFQQFPEISSARQIKHSPPTFNIKLTVREKLPRDRIRHIQNLFRKQFLPSGVPTVFKFYLRK